ncbi:transcriptional regulator, HxlR family [Nocardia amikacinitolerans]|uniref:Transcriptional regulator, HxlR family n=1 Tax=Nocardia amikacinitolerans TaxID=756689 RepID=A0A285LJC9_9NOCA|nr:helix-turn-helix domain-containing protein [Nocardia amikacinitolerans]MCP2278735.1 transcriptional regulator, HxlR family [Nocardia amikacinitolerans]MCP2298457.1 transcriptional regulator, HxlR family [Nocardia amikacinitolerans]MCP2318339.1 transcriptional regulator, HxlR family [Nocardia amikacinitolerans]SNY85054.1 transcriptional regulator, HxlR family [Nocardia amikacinitolerans]
MRYEDLADEPCSITRPLVVLGDRWTLVILKYAFSGIRRFNGFQSALGISRSRLQDRLDRLIEHGILVKRPAAVGAHEEYRLTKKGHDIYPILMAIRDWGDTYMAPDGPPVHYRHHDCTGEAHVRLECDSCGSEIAARDVSPEPGPGLTGADHRVAGPLSGGSISR